MTQDTNTTSGAADLPEALRRSTAADGKTELFNLPGHPLMVRAVDFNRIHTESEMQKAALAAVQATAAKQPDSENLRKALQFYADSEHFIKADDTAWDTVSGEPQNYWCDEAGTATVEDGHIARLALSGHLVRFEDDAAQPAAQQVAAYATLPTSNYAGRVYEDGFLIGTCPLYTADQMRAFADATNTLRASHGQAPAATTFCWATELAMVREPVTLTVKEAREVSDQMQRLHAASFKTELRNLTSIDLDGDQAVRLAFMSCREASAFKRAVEAHG